MTLDADERARVARVARALRVTRAVRRARAYARGFERAAVARGWAPGPTLWVEDHRGIELVTEPVAAGFEYRSLGLAGDDDFLLLSRPRDLAFERYLASVPGLGAPSVLRVEPSAGGRDTLCAACLDDRATLDTLLVAARRAGTFNIVPFRSGGQVWSLARRIAAAAGVTVRVAAAPPPIARAADDKLWFAEAVRALIGIAALPPTYRAHGPSAAAAALVALARDHERLVLKTPSSAGALGNVVFDAALLRGRPLGEIRARVVGALGAIGWSGPWPALVGVWERTALASPSVQIWIPASARRAPRLEGVFEQRLMGEGGRFVGASETTFAPALAGRVEREALALATLLRTLGYVGRASFDALLVGDSLESASLHWIECNARWGGVSIPMSIASRLGVRGRGRRLLIAQLAPRSRPASFAEVLAASAPLAFDARRRRGVLWLAPPYRGHRGLAFLAVARSTTEAEALAAAAAEALGASVPVL